MRPRTSFHNENETLKTLPLVQRPVLVKFDKKTLVFVVILDATLKRKCRPISRKDLHVNSVSSKFNLPCIFYICLTDVNKISRPHYPTVYLLVIIYV